MLRNGLRHALPQAGVGGGLPGGGGQLAAVDHVARQRADEIPATVEAGVQRGGVQNLIFHDVCLEIRDAQARPPVERSVPPSMA
jgi:hypothetical protein